MFERLLGDCHYNSVSDTSENLQRIQGFDNIIAVQRQNSLLQAVKHVNRVPLLLRKMKHLPAAVLRRFKSSEESLELGLDTILSRLVVEPISDSTVMVIPEFPDADTASAAVGHTHLIEQRICTSIIDCTQCFFSQSRRRKRDLSGLPSHVLLCDTLA